MSIIETLEVIDLNKKTVRELRELCKDRGIKNYYKMKKSEIVERLTESQENVCSNVEDETGIIEQNMCDLSVEEAVKEAMSVVTTLDSVGGGEQVTERIEQVETNVDEELIQKRKEYRLTMKEGDIVAAKLHDGKVISAKVIKNIVGSQKVKVETKLGTLFLLEYGMILWVKKGDRFPTAIYNMLRGVKQDEAKR